MGASRYKKVKETTEFKFNESTSTDAFNDSSTQLELVQENNKKQLNSLQNIKNIQINTELTSTPQNNNSMNNSTLNNTSSLNNTNNNLLAMLP